MFGAPVILNPILGIPLVLVPVVNAIIGYYTIKLGLINRIFCVSSLDNPPAFIGLPLSTMDWRAFILVILLIAIDMLIYYPFFKSYEKNIIGRRKSWRSSNII